MSRPHAVVVLVLGALFASILLAVPRVSAQSESAALQAGGLGIEWDYVDDELRGVQLPFAISGRVTGLSTGFDPIVRGLPAETRQRAWIDDSTGSFVVLVSLTGDGQETSPFTRGKQQLTLEILDYLGNVARRDLLVVGRRPTLSVDNLPTELAYPVRVSGSFNRGFLDADVSAVASIDGVQIRPSIQRSESFFSDANQGQSFWFSFDPRFTTGWTSNPGQTLDVTITLQDTAVRRVIRSFSIPLPPVERFCNGYGVTVDLARGGVPDRDRANVIIGTSGPDVIYGSPSDDIICGMGGSDTIYGGDGDDIINGGSGDDVVFGDAGDDVLEGRLGNDRLDGGQGNDTLLGGYGSDELDGGLGADSANGGGSRDACAAETIQFCERQLS